ALALHDRLAKPPGSLGRLEALGARLAGMAGTCPPPIPMPATVAVFAGDHGVVASGVTPWPQAITAAMVSTFAIGRAAVNAIARQVGAEVVVVDVGVACPYPPSPNVVDRKVRPGTDDLSVGPAMSTADAQAALDAGRDVARSLVAAGNRCLVTGDMGIGNTTPSAAIIAALTGADPVDATGRGTGIDDAMLVTKQRIVTGAVARASGLPPLELLAEIGGLEIAALAGYVLGGASAGVPVVLDGVIALAGAVVAVAIEPSCRDFLIAGHRSVEPAASAALTHLGLIPLLDLDLRLGEGTGALLALPLVQAAARVLNEMATLDELS
ncbi:MAG: nicotinate-nucleotide--dimethylbenzimidazole phosphoribosyltransferase, partial [Acidobacteria bacterium]|nr:nicotinate-nucleotide--dimethylbenzimidazole phosphoribosyltransferase [Acidobacteriota bacterium]